MTFTDLKLKELEDYAEAFGAIRTIKSILISNNGLAAVKFIKSIQSWSHEVFGYEK